MKVGVLALQGAFISHMEAFSSLGVEALEVRTPEDIEKVDRLVIPGGESTTISMLLDWNGMRAPIQESISRGMPIFGTCAGMIVLAREVLDGREDQTPLGAIDITVRRNRFLDRGPHSVPIQEHGDRSRFTARNNKPVNFFYILRSPHFQGFNELHQLFS